MKITTSNINDDFSPYTHCRDLVNSPNTNMNKFLIRKITCMCSFSRTETYSHIDIRIRGGRGGRGGEGAEMESTENESLSPKSYVMFESHASLHVDLHAAYGMFLN